MAHRSQVQSFPENVTLAASGSITPQFYKEAYRIWQTEHEDTRILQLFRDIDIRHSGEGDPTRPGPVRFPWHVLLNAIGWNGTLDDAMTTFITWVYHHIYLWAIQETNACIEPMDHPASSHASSQSGSCT